MINPNYLISSTLGDLTKEFIEWPDDEFNYYIFDQSVNGLLLGKHIKTLPHSFASEVFINNIFSDLSNLIALDFYQVFNEEESDLDIYSVSYYESFGVSGLGEIVRGETDWGVVWKNTKLQNVSSIVGVCLKI